MVDRSLRMWRFTLRLPHYIVKFLGFKLQQVVFCASCTLNINCCCCAGPIHQAGTLCSSPACGTCWSHDR